MTEAIRPTSVSDGAAPPGGGRQNHDVMQAGALRQVAGPASTGVLAASGGLDVPGREPHPELAACRPQSGQGANAAGESPAHEPIPGERDASTLTHRDVGAMGGQFAGADIPGTAPRGWMDERTVREHVKEGGGT